MNNTSTTINTYRSFVLFTLAGLFLPLFVFSLIDNTPWLSFVIGYSIALLIVVILSPNTNSYVKVEKNRWRRLLLLTYAIVLPILVSRYDSTFSLFQVFMGFILAFLLQIYWTGSSYSINYERFINENKRKALRITHYHFSYRRIEEIQFTPTSKITYSPNSPKVGSISRSSLYHILIVKDGEQERMLAIAPSTTKGLQITAKILEILDGLPVAIEAIGSEPLATIPRARGYGIYAPPVYEGYIFEQIQILLGNPGFRGARVRISRISVLATFYFLFFGFLAFIATYIPLNTSINRYQINDPDYIDYGIVGILGLALLLLILKLLVNILVVTFGRASYEDAGANITVRYRLFFLKSSFPIPKRLNPVIDSQTLRNRKMKLTIVLRNIHGQEYFKLPFGSLPVYDSVTDDPLDS